MICFLIWKMCNKNILVYKFRDIHYNQIFQPFDISITQNAPQKRFASPRFVRWINSLFDMYTNSGKFAAKTFSFGKILRLLVFLWFNWTHSQFLLFTFFYFRQIKMLYLCTNFLKSNEFKGSYSTSLKTKKLSVYLSTFSNIL